MDASTSQHSTCPLSIIQLAFSLKPDQFTTRMSIIFCASLTFASHEDPPLMCTFSLVVMAATVYPCEYHRHAHALLAKECAAIRCLPSVVWAVLVCLADWSHPLVSNWQDGPLKFLLVLPVNLFIGFVHHLHSIHASLLTQQH